MDKAILVVDMPSCCDECFALDDNSDYPMCLITGDFRGYRFRPKEQKMYNCPLKLIPQRKDFYTDTKESKEWYAIGYNQCIDEILNNVLGGIE